MGRKAYQPQNALQNPEGYYESAFGNYPRELTVPVVGNVAMRLTRPTVEYYDAETETEYFDQIDEGTSLVLTFTHRGRRRFHDPLAASAAVFGARHLLDRVQTIRVWAAAPYMTHPLMGPIVENLGGVPVFRSLDYVDEYGIDPTQAQRQDVTDALFSRSRQHLLTPGNTLVVFPAGTRQGIKLREGVGQVLEGIGKAATLPIALVSDSEKKSNRPRNLRISFGEPIFTQPGLTSSDYVRRIDENLNSAAALIGG